MVPITGLDNASRWTASSAFARMGSHIAAGPIRNVLVSLCSGRSLGRQWGGRGGGGAGGPGGGFFLSRPPSPDFCCLSVDCGWSSWSPWAECLGPCSSQSLQWSFRSPNNPRLSGHGRQCRGIHRKARRYRIGTRSILYPCLGGRLRFPL
jgi:hypothetical protein